MTLNIILCVVVLFLTVRVAQLGRRASPPALAVTSECTCRHAKSYHKDGKGGCCTIDTRLKYAENTGRQGSPPCHCQVYVPMVQPAAALPPALKPGQYDPAYTAFLEWWTDHHDPATEGKDRHE